MKTFSRILSLIALLWLIGCTPSQPEPVVPPTVTPSPTDVPPTFTVTLDTVILPTQTPTIALTVRIKNAASGLYLYEADGQAMLGSVLDGLQTMEWGIEDYQGSKRLLNLASGNYLSIEHLQTFVEVIPIEAVWMSPRWTFENDPALGATVIRNVWHNWEVLYTDENDALFYGRPPADESLSEWVLEPINGLTLTESTPTPVVSLPTPSVPAGTRGAIVPWLEYEAETAQTNGDILAPDRTFGTIASESSGRSAVKLDEVGEFVQFESSGAANSVVVRYVIPDSEDGKGLEATISLYVDGVFRQKLQLTSKYAWSYGGEEYTFNIPSADGAHHFYDEARALVGDIPAGALVMLQVDADDAAEYYVVDLVDLEQVAPPKEMPVGYMSLTDDCGAIPDDGEDDGVKIRACILQAELKGMGVWIPPGVFESNLFDFTVKDVNIRGAGMWYSVIQGFHARFNCAGNNCGYYDFAILGETITRDDQSPENGFNGGAGTGSRLENIWVEHTKVGYWVGGGPTNGLIIINSRFRNLFADGVNFCNGTSNSVIENSHFRNTGDDAVASWSPKETGVNTNNVFRFNTVQVPWRANCFAIYGGKDNRIEDNLCYDVVTYPGILIAQQFNSNPFSGTTVVQRNSIIRAGGPMFNKEHGALKIWADQGDIAGLVIRDLLIDGATFTGIEIDGGFAVTSAVIENVEIINSGTFGIYLHSNLAGDITFSFVTVAGSGKEGLLNYAPKNHFDLVLGDGNVGW